MGRPMRFRSHAIGACGDGRHRSDRDRYNRHDKDDRCERWVRCGQGRTMRRSRPTRTARVGLPMRRKQPDGQGVRFGRSDDCDQAISAVKGSSQWCEGASGPKACDAIEATRRPTRDRVMRNGTRGPTCNRRRLHRRKTGQSHHRLIKHSPLVASVLGKGDTASGRQFTEARHGAEKCLCLAKGENPLWSCVMDPGRCDRQALPELGVGQQSWRAAHRAGGSWTY